MFELASPWVLLALALPLLVYRFVKPVQQSAKHENHSVVVPFYTQLTQLSPNQTTPSQRSRIVLLTLSIIWILLVLAAAKPQWLGEPQALETSGRDLLLAVDISDSMSQEDMTINNRPASRLLAVKQVVSDFIQQRKGDRVGLILFGTNAYLQTPLTFDTASVEQFLQEAQLGFAGPKTAMGDAIGLSVKRLKDRVTNSSTDTNNASNINNSKVIILLTDGANTAGEVEPLQAAKLAAKIEAKIYTVGIGADEMVVRGFFGNRRINPSASLDEKTLTAIAATTGGQYFRARDTKELNNIYRELDKLEPTEQEKEWLRPVQSLFMWPLGLALLLSLLLAAGIYRLPLFFSLKQFISINKHKSKEKNHG
ncbi:MAG: Ca-activated chloride channel family protein [Kiritimatiellia bacterium]|jgi:Ca-activated chloride channel family protein